MLSLYYWNYGERNFGYLLNENLFAELFAIKITPPPRT